jgi:hypothetical protein
MRKELDAVDGYEQQEGNPPQKGVGPGRWGFLSIGIDLLKHLNLIG